MAAALTTGSHRDARARRLRRHPCQRQHPRQCEASAAVTLVGQLLCLSKTPHPGDNKTTVNKLSGNSTFIFDCNSSLSSGKGVLAWYPAVGS
jgi:hypothetical protein